MKLPAFPNTGREIREYMLAEAADFLEGAAVLLDGGEVDECGADPALITGFALHDAGADPFPDRLLVALASSKATFFIEGDRAPLLSDEGESYGITKDADGYWHLDSAKTGGSARLLVEKVDLTRNLFEVRVLDANRVF